MGKMDQNIPKIAWATEGFATGGGKGARNAKMSRNEQKMRK